MRNFYIDPPKNYDDLIERAHKHAHFILETAKVQRPSLVTLAYKFLTQQHPTTGDRK
jgi:hypothetical protein